MAPEPHVALYPLYIMPLKDHVHASNGPAIVLSFFLYKNNPNPACLLTAEIMSLYSSAGSSVEF